MRTRFAPSPTGPLHLGHAYSAMLAHDMALAAGGTFLLRIEDIDRARSRDAWERQIGDDLHWLGLDWPTPPMRQSDRGGAYAQALEELDAQGLVYPCRCSRADIRAALSAPQGDAVPSAGPDGPVYPGTCRPEAPRPGRVAGSDTVQAAGGDAALRLDIGAALRALPDPLTFTETGPARQGSVTVPHTHLTDAIGDVVLARPALAPRITSRSPSTMPRRGSPT